MSATATQPSMKFKVLHGMHSDGKDPDGKPRVYKQGDIVETGVDLEKKFNLPGARKFERVMEVGDGYHVPVTERPVPSSTQTASGPDLVINPQSPRYTTQQLESMSFKDLQSLAADEEVDLKGANRKEDILKILKAALGLK